MDYDYRVSFKIAAATQEEVDLYERVLYPLQDRVLEIAGGYRERLILTGGTALARVYFDHRYSEDIDLFTDVERVQPLAHEFLNAIRSAGITVDLTNGQDQPGFVRAFVGEERLKVDIAADLPRLDLPFFDPRLKVCVHTLTDLGGNKVVAYEGRAEIKDVVDLYYLAKSQTWPEMFRAADRKRVPIAYEELRFITSQPIIGTVLSKTGLDFDVETFVGVLNNELEIEIKKKKYELRGRVKSIVSDLLWDAPASERRISPATASVLLRRAEKLPEPARLLIEEAVSAE